MEIWEKYFKDLQISYQEEYTFKTIQKLQSDINYSKVWISGWFLQHNSKKILNVQELKQYLLILQRLLSQKNMARNLPEYWKMVIIIPMYKKLQKNQVQFKNQQNNLRITYLRSKRLPTVTRLLVCFLLIISIWFY